MNQDDVQPTVDLYVKATENDWRTMQPPAQPASAPPADASTATETKQLMNVARSILMNENGTME